MKTDLEKIPSFDPETSDLNAIIETPRGSRYKYAYQKEFGVFQLKKILPAGLVLPFDFGFVPSTEAEDRDPLDVLIITEEKLFPGCLVKARLIGGLECEQKNDRKSERNDRMIAVPVMENVPIKIHSIGELDKELVRQLESFFVVQHQLEGKEFKVVGTHGPARAKEIVQAAQRPKKH